MSGKGSHYRPVDQKTYGDNYDAIFNKEKNNASSPVTTPAPGTEPPEWFRKCYTDYLDSEAGRKAYGSFRSPIAREGTD